MAASVLLVAASAGAQDHVNVTIMAPTIGSIPQLAGALDIANSQSLIAIAPSGPAPTTGILYAGVTDAVHATMVLPWNGAASQVMRVEKAYIDGAMHPVDSVICNFVHAGSDQPYLTVVIHQPILHRITLAYDSVADSATATLDWVAQSVEYLAPASTQPSVRTIGARATITRRSTPASGRVAQLTPKTAPRLMLSPTALRALAMAGQAGPPVDAFLQFADAGPRNIAFTSESSFPSWTAGAMASAQALSVTATQPVMIVRATDENGVSYVTAHPQGSVALAVQITKAAGPLAAAIATAQGSHERLTVTIGLADAPGHLGARMTFNSALVASNSMGNIGGRPVEQIGLTPQTITISDLRNGTTLTF